MRWMGIGFEFLIVIGMFVAGGYWLDQIEGTTPGWMILGFFIGFGTMLYIMLHRAHRDEMEEQAERKKEEEAELQEEEKLRESKDPSSR